MQLCVIYPVKHFGDCNRSLRRSPVVPNDENTFCSRDFIWQITVGGRKSSHEEGFHIFSRSSSFVCFRLWVGSNREGDEETSLWKITLIRMEMGEWRLLSLAGRFNTYSRTNWG